MAEPSPVDTLGKLNDLIMQAGGEIRLPATGDSRVGPPRRRDRDRVRIVTIRAGTAGRYEISGSSDDPSPSLPTAPEDDSETEKIRQEAALESVGKHMDSLKAVTYWALSTVGLVFLFGVTPGPEIDFLGAKINRQSAVIVMALAYVVALLDVSILMNDLRDLLQILTGRSAKQAVYRVVYDDWVMNPFAYFTNTPGSLWWSWIGFGLSLLTIFLAGGSIVLLEHDHRSRRFVAMMSLLVAVALYTGLIAGRVFQQISRQREQLALKRLWEYRDYRIYLFVTYVVSISIAVGLTSLAISYRN